MNNKQEVTAQSYRQDRLNEIDTAREWINKNFETFWNLAKEAQIVMVEPIRIRTQFGDWTFLPALKLKYPLED